MKSISVLLSWILIAQAWNGAVSIKTGLSQHDCMVAQQFLIPSAPGCNGCTTIIPQESIKTAECLNSSSDNSINLGTKQ